MTTAPTAAREWTVTVMTEYIELGVLDKALTIAAANDKYKNRRTWAKAICVLHDLPAADVALVLHGRFVHNGPRFAHGVDWWRCSICGRLASGVETRFDYCPGCGARMDGDDDAKES